jgi:hypothetical protein
MMCGEGHREECKGVKLPPKIGLVRQHGKKVRIIAGLFLWLVKEEFRTVANTEVDINLPIPNLKLHVSVAGKVFMTSLSAC